MDAVLWVGDRPNFGSSRAILTCGQRGGAWPSSPLPGNVALGVPSWECGPQGSRTEMLVLVEKETFFFFFSLEIGSL